MEFMDAYKELEKLCSEIYQENHGVSSYIDDMKEKSDGDNFILGWRNDLKQLKHYRWVRNKIVHEPGCTQENMCLPEDELWIRNFCSRIRKGDDPLARYRRQKAGRMYAPHPPRQEPTDTWGAGFLTVVVTALVLLIVVVLLANVF